MKTVPPSRPVLAALFVGVAAGFLLCGYEFVRSVSASLFIGAFGAHRLPVVMVLSPVGTLAMIYGYGWLLSRMGTRRTLFLTSVFSGVGILLCYAAILAQWQVALGVLYVLREAYVVLIIEQYWSFINSTLKTDQAKKLNGPICGIASLGAISGGWLVGQLAQVLGSEQLLIFAGLSLFPAAGCAWWAYRLGGEPTPQDPVPHQGTLALGLFRHNRTLIYLALLIAVTQAVSTALELRFYGLVEMAMPEKDGRTAFMGDFYSTLNATASVFQFLVAPLILRFVPLRGIHVSMPVIHLMACAVLLGYPALWTGAAAFLIFKAIDYSVFRAGKEILYIPMSFDARYRAKEMIDAFVYRGSKGVLAGFFALLGEIFGRLPGAVYPGLAMVMAGVWGWLGIKLTGQSSEASEQTK